MIRLVLLACLVGCQPEARDVAERSYTGDLHCFGHRRDYTFCVNHASETFICFADGSVNFAACIPTVYDPTKTRAAKFSEGL